METDLNLDAAETATDTKLTEPHQVVELVGTTKVWVSNNHLNKFNNNKPQPHTNATFFAVRMYESNTVS